jgi:uncharacterized membrane protein YkoI
MTRSFVRESTPFLIGALVALMFGHLGPFAYADDDLERVRDQERARWALEQGEVRPLADILGIVRSRIDGEIVETEIENEDGAWVYEIKYISKSGRMKEIYVDGLSGRIVEFDDD